ncbi:hypothetical protein VPH35_074862 [Triticum aestivum]
MGQDNLCRDLWKVYCLPKIHHFLWRFAHNIHHLPRDVERIGVVLNTDCVLCHRLPEDGAHLFLCYKEVGKMWRACNLEHVCSQLLDCQTPKEVLLALLKMSNEVKT